MQNAHETNLDFYNKAIASVGALLMFSGYLNAEPRVIVGGAVAVGAGFFGLYNDRNRYLEQRNNRNRHLVRG